MPSVEVTAAEALLLALTGEEEGRLISRIVDLQRQLEANRQAAYRSILVSHGEPLEGAKGFKVLADGNGRAAKLEWEKAPPMLPKLTEAEK